MVIIIREIYIAILKDENKNLKKAAVDFAKLICIENNVPTLFSRKRNTLSQLNPVFSTDRNESCSRTTSRQQNTKNNDITTMQNIQVVSICADIFLKETSTS